MGAVGRKTHTNKGMPTTLTLSGIAYADSNELIPDLPVQLCDLSGKKGYKAARQERKANKIKEKQDNIAKWNEHIRKCAHKNIKMFAVRR